MDFGTHLLSGIVLSYFLTDYVSSFWILIIIFSLLPDLIGEFFYQVGRVRNGKNIKFIYDEEVTDSSKYLGNSKFLIPYDFLHSLLAIILLYVFSFPYELIMAYTSHILLDVVSHSKKSWGIMTFWPFYKKRFGPSKDWWSWKFLKGYNVLYFNLITYLITIGIVLIWDFF